ncbi:related to nitrogen assimilation transcription factor [Melanopsichium pennsylvanicum]|uniref:Related to nitrogen assimilation transcription factor n=2 Tax=Melanopsichium pennsylvanicum TaxID=63383 RepID=A0AAJ4XN83_9BASI|nr:related to nitrogen assimilation transcription factor [Melanopsichium pennsylvanicum 4]SNX86019.1 related to nitrogen assimilation transcription factor [Melanopsichium pennsylvanicum]
MAQGDRHSPPMGHDHHSDKDDNKDGQSTSGLKKRRIQQACRQCGIKRVKCDGSNPCITCVRSGEVCEYGQPKKRGPPKGSTRGASKAAKRKAEAQLSAHRKGVHESAAALPVLSTRDYAASISAPDAVPLSRPPPPPIPENDWSRIVPPASIANSGPVASSSRYPPHTLPHSSIPQQLQQPPPYYTAPAGVAGYNAPFSSEPYADTYGTTSAHASPEGSYRTESHRTGGTIHDDSVGSPNYGATSSSPGYYPPHSFSSRYDSALASQAPKPRTETFYRGSSSGLGFIRPPPGAADRRLPPLDFYSRSANRLASSPSNYGRLSATSDTFEAAVSGCSAANRSLHKTSGPYARPSPTTSSSAYAMPPSEISRFDNRSTQTNNLAIAHLSGGTTWSTAQNVLPPQAHSLSDVADSDKPAIGRPAGVPQSHFSDNNQLLVEGTLLQMQRDRNRELRKDAAGADPSAGAVRPQHVPEDIKLEPLLWVEPGDESRCGVNRSGVSLSKPEIPPLIQERLFTIFWGIVQTVWPALYKPALCLTGFNVIDSEKHPMLHNAACALAAVAWDSGEFGMSEEDTEATQSDLVERTASDLSYSQVPGQLGDGTSLRRLSAVDLGDIFLARAKYYLVKTNNEPSLETIQSLLFMALREGGNGRASQASAYISTACRMCIDLGLHRQRDFSSVLGLHFSHAEEQARRRIFWCLYLLDKTSSASLGRPVTLRYAEIDCPLPNIDEADEHETWAETTNNSSLIKDRARSVLLKTPVAAMTHLNFGVRLGHICEQVIAMYTQVRRPGGEDEEADDVTLNDSSPKSVPEWETRLIRLHRMINSWERDLPYRLRFDDPSHRLPNTLSQHLWFQVCKVMLHRPYILKKSSRPDLPPSHRICTDAVGSICDILTAYDNNFGMRKLSSTFTYCIFTASTIEIANTTSTDAAIAAEAKRRLRKFMTWLSRMSGTWQSASHHLKILEQLGHGIDADLDGTGLPSHRGEVSAGESAGVSAGASRADSPTAAATMMAATGAVAKVAGVDVGPSPLSLSREAQELLVDLPTNAQQQVQSTDLNTTGVALTATEDPTNTANTNTATSSPFFVPGPIGAPMYLTRSRASYQIAPALQDNLQAQFQAQGQNPGSLYAGWPTMTQNSRVATPTPDANINPNAGVFDSASQLNADRVPASTAAAAASDSGVGAANAAAGFTTTGPVNPTAYLKLHDTSYWGAMPLASEDALSWANFTNSYIEALNGMTHPNMGVSNTGGTSSFVDAPSFEETQQQQQQQQQGSDHGGAVVGGGIATVSIVTQ